MIQFHDARSLVLIGKPQGWQHHLGLDLAFRHAVTGAQTVGLSDAHSDLIGDLNAWKLAPGNFELEPKIAILKPDARDDDVAAFMQRIHKTVGTPRLILRDMSRSTRSLEHDGHWFQIAHELVANFGCCVLTIGHSGPSPFDIQDLAADETWEVTGARHTKHQNDIACHIQRKRPKSNEKTLYLGTESRSWITFAPADEVPIGNERGAISQFNPLVGA